MNQKQRYLLCGAAVLLIAVSLTPNAVQLLRGSSLKNSTEPGGIVAFGSFFGETLYWRVDSVENGTATLVAVEPIVKTRFGNDNNWEDSDLRYILNEPFLHDAFNDGERALIQKQRRLLPVTAARRHEATHGRRELEFNHVPSRAAIGLLSAFSVEVEDYVTLPDLTMASRNGCRLPRGIWLSTPYYYNTGYLRAVTPQGITIRHAAQTAGVVPVIRVPKEALS